MNLVSSLRLFLSNEALMSLPSVLIPGFSKVNEYIGDLGRCTADTLGYAWYIGLWSIINVIVFSFIIACF